MSRMVGGHTVSSFTEELRRLDNRLQALGGMAREQLDRAIEALESRNSENAEAVILRDSEVDQIENGIHEDALRILALREPKATDLRYILTSLRNAADLERMGDLAENIAKHAVVLKNHGNLPELDAFLEMARLVSTRLETTLQALSEDDADLAMTVWNLDREVDERFNTFVSDLTANMESHSSSVAAGVHLLFMAKSVERIGDLSTNLAENTYYLVKGTYPRSPRPQVDEVGNPKGRQPARSTP
ncbi:MAG: phosphate signaling complex protein PhoU [Magnetococcales bacterium]|nr:phosphate signaling complex protein PhoU [Magnetococcales bacterium]